ncbi:MAG: hypothetical protein HC772_08375 [Leptolyngbyaceae cyanobacterium CRU_2_3]|nr:hypothetical protein [Leptolyngbyaceae cyanobacterium CRU_2_3]
MKADLKSHSVHRLAWVTLSLLVGIGLTGIAQPAQAQTNSADLSTPVGSSDRDANTNGDLNGMGSMF